VMDAGGIRVFQFTDVNRNCQLGWVNYIRDTWRHAKMEKALPYGLAGMKLPATPIHKLPSCKGPVDKLRDTCFANCKACAIQNCMKLMATVLNMTSFAPGDGGGGEGGMSYTSWKFRCVCGGARGGGLYIPPFYFFYITCARPHDCILC
jgi:hypothetical protein